jgi:hypothetical protein
MTAATIAMLLSKLLRTNWLQVGQNTVIPDGIVTLGTFAFAQFKGTFSLTIPESVTTFEFGAIHMCPGLTTVNIPSGITSMDMMLFGGCDCIAPMSIAILKTPQR